MLLGIVYLSFRRSVLFCFVSYSHFEFDDGSSAAFYSVWCLYFVDVVCHITRVVVSDEANMCDYMSECV